jgi:hypothetical protein
MSTSRSTDRITELSDIFVSVTGNKSVTEPQSTDSPDREIRPEEEFDPDEVADGLDDAVAGSETGDTSDPAA